METRGAGDTMNATPALFRAAISSKFTKRHGENFRDTSLDAASAAKERADRRIEKQAEAIEKQQKKIESEMKKIEQITQKLHRQQVREAKRLRGRLDLAASRIQRIFRKHWTAKIVEDNVAARVIQHRWGTFLVQRAYQRRRAQLYEAKCNASACLITRNLRIFACRRTRRTLRVEQNRAAFIIQRAFQIVHAKNILRVLRLEREYRLHYDRSATIIQANVRCFLARIMYYGILDLICRIQGVMRGFLVRNRIRKLQYLHEHAVCCIQALYRGYRVRKKLYDDHQAISTSIRLIRRTKRRRNSRQNHQPVQQQMPTLPNKVNEQLLRKSMPAVTFVPSSSSPSSCWSSSPNLAGEGGSQPGLISPAPRRNFWLPSGVGSLRNPRSDLLAPLARAKSVGVNTVSTSQSPQTLSFSPTKSTGFKRLRRLPNRRLGHAFANIRLMPVQGVAAISMSSLSSLESDCSTYQRRCEESTWTTDGVNGFANPPGDFQSELVAEAIARRVRREHELTRKLTERKLQDKLKRELEALREQELQRQEIEQKQMQREDKRVRLVQKEMQRRQHEAKLKRKTLQQQREERERSLMSLEERRTKLLLKQLARRKQQKAAMATSLLAPSCGSLGYESQTALESIDKEILKFFANVRGREEENSEEKLQAPRSPCMSSRSTHSSVPKGCATFQSLSLKPRKSKKTKNMRRANNRKVNALASVKNQNQNEFLDFQVIATCFDSSESADTFTTSNSQKPSCAAPSDIEDADWDYGDEFDELVEETQLNKLLCSL